MARSRSGTRGRRGPRKPPRRDGSGVPSQVQVLDPRERGAIELPGTITVKELAELLSVNPADVIRELIKSGIFATINQLIDRDTASLVAGELGYEVAESAAPAPVVASRGRDQFAQRAQGAWIVARVVRLPGARGTRQLVRTDHVAQPQFHRVESESPGGLVDQPFPGPGRLRLAEPAVGTGRCGRGDYAPHAGTGPVEAVRSG